MRALWLVRDNLDEHPGGDTTQLHCTAAALRERGISVELSSDPAPDLGSFDIVHLFHLDRLWENTRWCQQIRSAGIPSVLSPIYWPSKEFDRNGRAGVQGVMSRLAGGSSYQNLRIMQRSALPALIRRDFTTFSSRMFSFHRSARYLLNTVDAILPNSHTEEAQIERDFGTPCKSVVIPNAADPATFAPAARPRSTSPPTVLSVGRIEPRKNQLALIRALRDTIIQLRIVGRSGRFSGRYCRLCRREAGPNTTFLGWQSPSEVSRLYQDSQVHASVSWYETPGLASLEAALCGCRLVMTPGGSTREYFDNEVDYCSPNDLVSIRQAVYNALAHSPSQGLAQRVTRDYTWDLAAERTLGAYDYAVKRESRRRRSSGPVAAEIGSASA